MNCKGSVLKDKGIVLRKENRELKIVALQEGFKKIKPSMDPMLVIGKDVIIKEED